MSNPTQILNHTHVDQVTEKSVLVLPEFRCDYAFLNGDSRGKRTITAMFPKEKFNDGSVAHLQKLIQIHEAAAKSKGAANMTPTFMDGDGQYQDSNLQIVSRPERWNGHFCTKLRISGKMEGPDAKTIRMMLRNPDGSASETKNPKEFYSGCYAQAIIEAYHLTGFTNDQGQKVPGFVALELIEILRTRQPAEDKSDRFVYGGAPQFAPSAAAAAFGVDLPDSNFSGAPAANPLDQNQQPAEAAQPNTALPTFNN